MMNEETDHRIQYKFKIHNNSFIIRFQNKSESFVISFSIYYYPDCSLTCRNRVPIKNEEYGR